MLVAARPRRLALPAGRPRCTAGRRTARRRPGRTRTSTAWHRAYMLEFERALQAAAARPAAMARSASRTGTDRRRGRSSPRRPSAARSTSRPAAANGATGPAPRAICSSSRSAATRRSSADAPSSTSFRFTLKYFKTQVDRALSQPQHQLSGVDRGRRRAVDRVAAQLAAHRRRSFPMSSIPYASYLIYLFFLHHANVDRQYEAYLLSAPPPRSSRHRRKAHSTADPRHRNLWHTRRR